jgi:hypothetical protein
MYEYERSVYRQYSSGYTVVQSQAERILSEFNFGYFFRTRVSEPEIIHITYGCDANSLFFGYSVQFKVCTVHPLQLNGFEDSYRPLQAAEGLKICCV